uniref:Cyclic nucleotide-binding domain-containing protein n=1 Tax=Ditylenchus dipsaci TaxID=166011 RepID=A0A915DSM0_9BILA
MKSSETILRDVEENTVRLKEHGQDVLVLERIIQPVASTSMALNRGLSNGMIESDKKQFSYSVMAGLPEKMVEYLLETRIDSVALDFNSSPGSENGFVGPQDQTFGPVLVNELDTFLEDFILTHIIFMPSNLLCNYLKNYYLRNYKLKGSRAAMTGLNNGIPLSQVFDSDYDNCERLTTKRRVVFDTPRADMGIEPETNNTHYGAIR